MELGIDSLPAKLKIVMLGGSNVGKTSVIEAYIKNKFRDFYEVFLTSFSLQYRSISSLAPLCTRADPTACRFGTQPVRKGSSPLPPVTLRTQTVP